MTRHPFASLALALLILLGSLGVASAQDIADLQPHLLANGKPDPGTSVSLPDGSTETTFSDGWVRTTGPDTSFGPGGSRTIEKDPQGRVRHIVNYDAKHMRRHFTTAEEMPDSTIQLIHFNYDENGSLMDVRVEMIGGAPGAVGTTNKGSEGSPAGAPTTGSGGQPGDQGVTTPTR